MENEIALKPGSTTMSSSLQKSRLVGAPENGVPSAHDQGVRHNRKFKRSARPSQMHQHPTHSMGSPSENLTNTSCQELVSQDASEVVQQDEESRLQNPRGSGSLDEPSQALASASFNK